MWLVFKPMRYTMDFLARFDPKTNTEREWLNRMIFLESVAGIPPMVASLHRHLKSLRTIEHDHGWIHHLL